MNPLRVAQLEPLMQRLGMPHQLPGLMQLLGIALGGRFELPPRTVLAWIRAEGPELKLEAMLGMLPDVPPQFLDLLALGLSERPRQLRGLWALAAGLHPNRWPMARRVLCAVGPDHAEDPGPGQPVSPPGGVPAPTPARVGTVRRRSLRHERRGRPGALVPCRRCRAASSPPRRSAPRRSKRRERRCVIS